MRFSRPAATCRWSRSSIKPPRAAAPASTSRSKSAAPSSPARAPRRRRSFGAAPPPPPAKRCADHGAMARSVDAHRHFRQQRNRAALGPRTDRSVVDVPDARGRFVDGQRGNRERKLYRRRPRTELSDLDRIDPQSAQSGDAEGVPLPQRNLNTIMRCGLFGKLGAKRDFIALATPRSFLEAWEPWVQSCDLGEPLPARRPMAAGVSDRAGLAVLAWRRNLRHHGRGRDHVVARRHGALLSPDAARDRRCRRSDFAARRRYAGRVVRPGREISAVDAGPGCHFRRHLGRDWRPGGAAERESRAAPTPASCRSATTWPEWSIGRNGFRDDTVGASAPQSRGLCCGELLVDSRRRRFSSAWH